MHEDQLFVDAGMVRRLVDRQFPHWRVLPVVEVATTGTVNAIFRIGSELAARFPLVAREPNEARDWLTAEAAAARELAELSPVPTPKPVAMGEPGEGYPSPWSVQTWLTGCDASEADPSTSMEFAQDLAAFIGCLRAADTRGRTFTGNGRGGDLPDHDEWMQICFRQSTGLFDVMPVRELWGQLRTLPEVDPDCMCHGDLTPANVLVENSCLAGVLDGGGFAAADPALDLVSAWHLLEHEPRELLRNTLGCSEIQWRRGMAWALQQSMGLVWYYAESNPSMSAWGRRTLDRLLSSR